MPANRKPRKPYRQRRTQSIYPDLHDIGTIFRPLHRLFEQLRSGEVDAIRGKLIFTDWQGGVCEVVPALEGWRDCWLRISEGEGFGLTMQSIDRVVRRLKFCVPLTLDEVNAAYTEMLLTQRLIMRVPRARLGELMRTQQIADEVELLGLANAAA